MISNVRFSRINTALLVLIILINSYIVALPLLPGVIFQIQTRDGSRVQKLEANVQQPQKTAAAGTQENRLVVPSMLLDELVHEGKNASTLRQGLWRRPHTSTPDKNGNTVIVGHRLTYTDPKGSLYHLDKARPGDSIGLTWDNKKYLYTVTEIKVVSANETSVEAPTSQPQLTIYTCTPLWLSKDRLVVTAALEKVL